MTTTTLDKAGTTASLICAFHCAVTPVALGILPLLGLNWVDNPWVDRGFLFFAFLLAIIAHPKGYVKHRRCIPAFLALAGLIGIILAVSVWEGVPSHHYLIALGGLMVAGSHWLNRHYCHSACCDHHKNS